MDLNLLNLVSGHGGPHTTKEPNLQFKEVSALFSVKAIDQEKRRVTAYASTGQIDRDGEIIEPTAFTNSLAGFMKNPVVLTSHQHRLDSGHSSVIANVVDANIDANGVLVTVEFAQGTELSDEYWALYSQKKQRAFSVGFIPRASEYRDVNGQRILVHTEVEWIAIKLRSGALKSSGHVEIQKYKGLSNTGSRTCKTDDRQRRA